MIRQFSAAAIEAMVSRTALKRLVTAEEVAELAVWLSSDACSFNTGAVFDLSGGRRLIEARTRAKTTYTNYIEAEIS